MLTWKPNSLKCSATAIRGRWTNHIPYGSYGLCPWVKRSIVIIARLPTGCGGS